MTWLDDLRSRDLRAVVVELGGDAGAARGRPGPCPSCQARDVAVWAGREGEQRWTCHRCLAGGDVVDLVAYALTGERYQGQAEVRTWAGEAVIPAAPPVPPPSRPPLQEVMDLLSRCQAGGDGETWIRGRGLRGELPSGCLGTLPSYTQQRLPMPTWAACGGQDWQTSGHRYLIPLCDGEGTVLSVRARRGDEGKGTKSLPPSGHSVKGLWMASRWGRAQLAADALWRGTVVLVEGEPAWLLAVAHWEPRGVLVLGFFAGSCQASTRARLAQASSVLVAVDDDPAGRRYVRDWSGGGDPDTWHPMTTAKDAPWSWSIDIR